jgi:lysophospholipase L1-like esterase
MRRSTLWAGAQGSGIHAGPQAAAGTGFPAGLSLLRRAAMASAIVAGSVAATVGAVALLFRAEGHMAADAVGHRLGDRGPDADRVYRQSWGNPVRLLMAGDSVADSLGAATAPDTLGALLAVALSDHTHRAVELRTVAVVGAETSTVHEQIYALPSGYVPDIAVVIVGGNDLFHHVPTAQSVHELQDVIRQLRDLGSEVVVGTCPDFDTLPALPQPLREYGGQRSRRLALAQYRASVQAGARPVLLGRAVRKMFLQDPAEMFAVDKFHPSSMGYRGAARVMTPSVLDACDNAGSFDAGLFNKDLFN